MIRGAIIACIASFIMSLILPAILGFVLTTIFSGLTLLDPLYADDRNTTAWFTLMIILVFQGLHACITAPLAGVGIGYLGRQIKSGWLYLLGVVVTVVLHYIFLFVFAFITSVFTSEDIGIARTISLFLITFISPLIGVIIVFSIRRVKG